MIKSLTPPLNNYTLGGRGSLKSSEFGGEKGRLAKIQNTWGGNSKEFSKTEKKLNQISIFIYFFSENNQFSSHVFLYQNKYLEFLTALVSSIKLIDQQFLSYT